MASVVQISQKARNYIFSGHLWVFANEFKTKVSTLKKGEWVDFYFKDEFVGYGYVNPHSLICGRVCSRTKISHRLDMIKGLLQKALGKRDLNLKSFRAVFAESDNLPGLIVDVYEKVVVVQSTTAGMDEAFEDWKQAIIDVLNPKAFVARGDSSVRHLEGVENWKKIILGEEQTLSLGVVQEDDVLVAADFVYGQKTGFFIDQRENRRHLKSMAQGKRVLDLCCYSGGWGLSALRGGANHVTFVDQSSDAINLVKRGLELNHFSSNKASLHVQDVFEYLKSCSEKFDIVICDPPAFVKSKKNIPQAEQAYFKLNSMALKVLAPEGSLYSCSCSFHMSEERFLEILSQAFQNQGAEGVVGYRGTQSGDHPWVINRPESKYLKCIQVQLQSR